MSIVGRSNSYRQQETHPSQIASGGRSNSYRQQQTRWQDAPLECRRSNSNLSERDCRCEQARVSLKEAWGVVDENGLEMPIVLKRPKRSRGAGHLPSNEYRGQVMMDIAVEYARAGHRVAVVNPANAHNPGGGFKSGGKHALEEAICMQSSLYPSLEKAAAEARRRGESTHIPDDGVLVSRNVVVFRSGTADQYRSIHPVMLAGVVSVAMPNLNPDVNSTPVDRRSFEDYQRLVEHKWAMVLEGAAEVEANILVVTDAGCGVFQNDPATVGRLLGAALCRCPASISRVVFTGSRAFFGAAIGQ